MKTGGRERILQNGRLPPKTGGLTGLVVSEGILHVWLYSSLVSSKALYYEFILMTFILVSTT